MRSFVPRPRAVLRAGCALLALGAATAFACDPEERVALDRPVELAPPSEPPPDYEGWPAPPGDDLERHPEWRAEYEAPRAPAPARPERDDDAEPFGHAWRLRRSRVQVAGYWLPVVSLVSDEDRERPGRDPRFDLDIHQGEGLGGRIGVGDPVSIGLFYTYSRHDIRHSDATLEAHGMYLEALAGATGGGPVLGVGGYIALGLGGTVFDLTDSDVHDTGGAAAEVRAALTLRLFDRVDLEGGGGAFVWGVPDDAFGWGAFLTVGITIRF